jgi:hypothetical protein
MDYRTERLFLGKHRVKQLCVVGVAAERFWELAFRRRRGMSSLVSSDVATVELRGVVMNGRKKKKVDVGLTGADSELALRVAQATVRLAERHGFRVLNAVVPQKDSEGVVVGEHDLLCERQRALQGLSSWEVKLRQLKTRGLKLATVRRQVQTAAWRGRSGRMWPVAREQGVNRKKDCVERVSVLMVWGPGDDNALGDWSDVYAEAIPASVGSNDPGDWTPVWGWKNPLVVRAALRINKTSVLKARARLAATAKAKAEAQTAAVRKRKQEFDAEYADVRKCTLNRRQMGSVSDLLNQVDTAACRRVRPSVGQKLRPSVWPRKWGWCVADYGKHKACAARSGGGEEGHCATKACLSDIYDFVKPPPPAARQVNVG